MKTILIATSMIFMIIGCTESAKKEQPKQSQSESKSQVQQGGSLMHFEPIPENNGDEMPEF